MHGKLSALLVFLLTAGSALPSLAATDAYVGGYVGWNSPHDFQNIDPSFIRGNNLRLESGPVYGVRLGAYHSTLRWIGAELDISNTHLQLGQQRHALTTGGTVATQGASLRVTSVAPLLMVRCLSLDKWMPYAGIGPAFFFANLSNAQGHSSDNAAIGFRAKGGVEYHLTPVVGLFTEYQFAWTRLDLQLPTNSQAMRGDYQGHQAVLGVAYHF